nr:transcription antitermination factor NusB [Desulfurispira natronophila]
MGYALRISRGVFDGGFLEQSAQSFEIPLSDFSRELINAALNPGSGYNDLIDSLAKNADMLTSLDRHLMLQAMGEMDMRHSPAQTIINEYIELAKLYGADNSYRFVNVVLNQYKERLA